MSKSLRQAHYQLSLEAGLAAKSEGLRIVEEHAPTWLQAARNVAERLIRTHGKTTAEVVIATMGGIPDEISRNTAGAIFNDKRFIQVGRTRSEHKAAHGREVKEWGLRDA